MIASPISQLSLAAPSLLVITPDEQTALVVNSAEIQFINMTDVKSL
jgi:hypothetical protein